MCSRVLAVSATSSTIFPHLNSGAVVEIVHTIINYQLCLVSCLGPSCLRKGAAERNSDFICDGGDCELDPTLGTHGENDAWPTFKEQGDFDPWWSK